jgi:hypothetical protein
MSETDDMNDEQRKPVESSADESASVAPADKASMPPATSADSEDDGVTAADEQSFPASDAPPWTSSAT